MSILDKGMKILNEERTQKHEESRRQEEARQNRQMAAHRRIIELRDRLKDSLLAIDLDDDRHTLTVSRKSSGEELCRVRTRWDFPWREHCDGAVEDLPPRMIDEMQYLKDYRSSSNINYKADGVNSGWHYYNEDELARFLVQNL